VQGRSLCQPTGLIEVLVSIGILGVVSAALTSSIVSMMTAQKMIESRQNISTLVNDVQALVSNGSTCLNLFGNGTSNFNYAKSKTADGSPVGLKLNNETLSDSFTSSAYDIQISKMFLANGTLAGVNSASLPVYKAQLIGEFKPTAGVAKLGGLSDFKPRILTTAFFTVNANKIIGCSSESPVEQSMVADLCKGMGGVYNASTKKCSSLVEVAEICSATGQTYNSSTQKCNPVRVVASTGGGGDVDPVSSAPKTGVWKFVSKAGTGCSSAAPNPSPERDPAKWGSFITKCSPVGTVKSTNPNAGIEFFNGQCTHTYQCQ
jgi:type II secretory pathway pseudopilin PulG